MCHIGLIVHESIAMESKFKGLTEDERVSFRNSLEDDNSRNCYLRDIPDFESAVKYCSGLIDIARPLLTANPLTQQEFDDILRAVDYNSPIAISANSLCVYGIVFTLLHEASHVILGQDLMKKGTVQEEIEADHNAFWALSNDLEGKQRNTAMMGCICALTSLLFFNPGLTPDENFPHPREDDRLFSFYDILKSEKNSYTEMITILLAAWATTFHVENFPVLSLSYEDSLARQRSFLSSIGRVEA